MSTTFGHANNGPEDNDDDHNKTTQQRLGRQSPPEHNSEWDSDIDDSSEEFEYVKGTDHHQQQTATVVVNGADADGHDDGNTTKRVENLGTIGEEEVWNAHADKIPVATTKGTETRFSCDLFSRSRNETV